MDDKRQDLSKYRLERAKEEIKISEELLTNKHFNKSLNASYYAMFHTVRALFAFDKIDFRQHSRVIEYFIENYVNTGLIENLHGKMLKDAKGKREQSDYRDHFHAKKEDAEIQLKNAKEFLPVIEVLIKKRLK